MAIVRMKRLRLLTISSERARLMQSLALYGAVELSETEGVPEAALEVGSAAEHLREKLSRIESAKDIAKKYEKHKKGLFSPRPGLLRDEVFGENLPARAEEISDEVLRREEELKTLLDEKARISALLSSLEPWEGLPVPLDTPQGKRFRTTLLTVPAALSDEAASAVNSESDCAALYEISKGAELMYALLIAHTDEFDKVFSKLRALGGAVVYFKGNEGVAKEEIQKLSASLSDISGKISEAKKKMSVSKEDFEILLKAQDVLGTQLSCEAQSEKGISTQRAFYIEGWVPAREEKNLSRFLEENECAYEFSDPTEEDTPPTLTYNSKLVAPFEVVTNMYSAPAYRGVDPNPTMAPFFALFFGIMLSDAGYGLLLMLAGIFALWKLKPRGGFKSFMQLAIICGASTIVWGLLFGGFFGDAIPSVYRLFTGKTFPYDMALWFNPTTDPMTMLIFSLALGGVQIVAGMAVKGYMMIRDGAVWDAIFDIGFWWLAFAGCVVAILGSATVGLYMIIAGAVGLILTQGRAKKNIIMKFFSGLLSLYDVTGYFSDILSYSRLLALSLSTAVVATVINTMGILTGPIGFFVVFIIGHVFNIAINLVGSFVHSARLQYVEYFGKFYESGGRVFAPLCIKTKNTDIIKEEI